MFFLSQKLSDKDEDKNIIHENMEQLKTILLFLSLFDTAKKDIRTRLIPTRGICLPVLVSILDYFIEGRRSIPDMIAGSLLISLLFLAAALLSGEGIGGGDIKLMWAWGMYLGSERILYAAFLGLFLAALATLPFLKQRKLQATIPLGPFLCVGIFLAIVF